MRLAFFGTPDFATATLSALVEHGHEIVAVITAPDKPKGRGQQMSMSHVKQYALNANLHILQPEKLKSQEFVEVYRSLKVDLAIVVAFRMLPQIIWEMPRYGSINLHGSLLPQYRGAAPINWALINGETKTGVTTFFINQNIDCGDLIAQRTVDIYPEDDFGSLYSRMKDVGANLVIETLDMIKSGAYVSKPQKFSPDDRPAPKITKELLEIKNFDSCIQVHHLIRGLIPVYKPFWIHHGNKFIIRRGHYKLVTHQLTPGDIYTDHKSYLGIVCKDGYYMIEIIQPNGKKAMDIVSFFNGHRI